MRIKYFNTRFNEWYDLPFSKKTFINILSFGLNTGNVSKLSIYSK